MASPFARIQSPHPALAEHYKLPPDTYYPLVEDFLHDERFVKWSIGYRPWQLHCHGGPGSGKTTFAAIVVDRLRTLYKDPTVQVASILLREAVYHDHAALVEDFLASVYYQISSKSPRKYEEACRDGRAYVDRMHLVREALHEQLVANQHNFLVLDGFDSLDAASRLLLHHELRDSHVRNLSLLITRRNPPFRKPEEWNVGCDICGKEGLLLYWECQSCADNGPQFCYRCKEERLIPADFEHDHDLTLAEPYDRIDMDISTAQTPQRFDMKQECLLPLHQFVSMQLQLGGRYSDDLARYMTKKASGNINMAKLRLDDALNQDATNTDVGLRDRLPRSIVAFFDSEVERIVAQVPSYRELGLTSIVAVAEYEDYETRGMLIDDLRRLTKVIRSIEDVLDAARGLLTLQPYDDAIRVASFHQQFGYYVREDYNETLYQVRAKLKHIRRSVTSRDEDGAWGMARLVSSPPMASELFNDTNTKIAHTHDSRDSSFDSAYYSGNVTREATMANFKRETNETEPAGLFQDNSVIFPWSARPSQPSGSSSETSPTSKGVGPGPLCSFCEQRILGTQLVQGDHYKSLQEFRNMGTATACCAFCSCLYHDILALEENSSLVSSKSRWPRYSWAARSAGKTRNARLPFAVTFTPIASKRDDPVPSFPTKRFHILADSDTGYIPTSIVTSTDPDITGGAQLKSWIKTCSETHPNCNRSMLEPFVPKRLVDVRCKDSSMVRVVDSRMHNIKGPYLTLSHSWGPPTFLQLTRENEERLMGSGLNLAELTINFREAICVARVIGVRYIWIDSLCIVQGQGGDFASEGQLMHKVYRSAFCNIAIADSADSKGGLFRSRHSGANLPPCYEADGSGKLEQGRWRILREDFWEQDLLRSKVYTRGWVFQERMLAPRILHFASKQIFWDCSTLSACEVLPHGLPHALDGTASTDRHWRGRMQSTLSSNMQGPLVGANNDSIEAFWRSALLNYTSCNLTNQKDKTLAIWSIAKLVRDVLGEEYGGGLWENALEEQLAWRMQDVTSNARETELQAQYPSWSWSSLRGAVIAHERLVLPRTYRVTNHFGDPIGFELESYQTRDVEPQLSRKSIKISGFVGRASLASRLDKLVLDVIDSDDKPIQQASSGVLEVFLDEFLPENYALQKQLRFIVLAASEHSPADPGSITSAINATNAAVIKPNVEPSTYSGTAILLISFHVYMAQQQRIFKSLLKEVVNRSPDHLSPIPQFGKGKSLIDHLSDVRKLVATLKESQMLKRQEGGGADCYRRIGAIEFRGMEEDTWRVISGKGRENIWLE